MKSKRKKKKKNKIKLSYTILSIMLISVVALSILKSYNIQLSRQNERLKGEIAKTEEDITKLTNLLNQLSQRKRIEAIIQADNIKINQKNIVTIEKDAN